MSRRRNPPFASPRRRITPSAQSALYCFIRRSIEARATLADLPDVPNFSMPSRRRKTSCKKSPARRARFGVIWAVESHRQKYCCFRLPQITPISDTVSSHSRGVSRSSWTRYGMRWTRQRFARDGVAGRVERLVSDHRVCGREMLLRTAKSCGPDAPTLASSSRSCDGPTGLRQNHIRGRRWQKSPVTGESTT